MVLATGFVAQLLVTAALETMLIPVLLLALLLAAGVKGNLVVLVRNSFMLFLFPKHFTAAWQVLVFILLQFKQNFQLY